jgi:hypothetical protein
MLDLAIIHQELHTQPTKKENHMIGKILEMQQEQEMRKPLASTLEFHHRWKCLGKRRLKAIAWVDSLTLCGIRLQGTIAWVLSVFCRKDNCSHRDKVTLLLLIER